MYTYRSYPYADQTCLKEVRLRKADASKSLSVTLICPQLRSLAASCQHDPVAKVMSLIPALMSEFPINMFRL